MTFWAFRLELEQSGFWMLKLPDGSKVEVFGPDRAINRHLTRPLPHTPRGIYGGVSPETRSDRQEVVPMMNGYAMSGWGWLLMTLGMLGLWALVAVLVLALLRRPGQSDQPPPPDQQPRLNPEEVLAERLARGELDPDEYRQRLQTLQATTNRT